MATASYSGGAGIHLQSLVLDSSTTAEQKADCLKLLKVVIKNLADPVKNNDVKYRTLKLENPKIQKVLPAGFEYLKALGFVEMTDEEGARVLRIDHVNVDAMNASLAECTNALDIVSKSQPQSSPGVAVTNKKPRVAAEENKKTSDSRPLVKKSSSMERLSEKQKARLLMEERAEREKEEARKHRDMTSKQIKQDKHVRKNDPNWKPGVCAAAGKTGNSISTFRDRHGEN